MDLVEELLESACEELESLGHPEIAARLRGILAEVEKLEKTEEPEAIEDEAEIPEDF